VAGGEVLAGAIDVRAAAPPAGRRWPPRGTLRLADLEAFAGVEIAAADVERWLGGLGFGLEPVPETGGEAWEVTAPSWRWYDVEPGPDGAVYPADFYEEVLRHLGFDEVPSALPLLSGSDGSRTGEQRRRDGIRDRLAAAGFAEAIHYAFQTREADAAVPVALHRAAGLPEAVAEAPPLGLANPLSERYAVMRRSLVPNLVDTARFNRRRGADAVRLFEIGHLFFDLALVAATGRDGLPVEEVEAVALVAGGAVGTPWSRRFELDLFDLKGAAEELVASLGGELVARPAELAGVVPGTGAEFLVRDAGAAADGEPRPAGWMGRVDDPAEDPAPLFAVELATAALGGERGPVPVDPPSKFPGIEADLTLTHPLAVPWAELEAAIEANRPADLAAYGLKDRYAGRGVPAGAVNTTLGFHYVSPERSLTQDEVNERQRRLAEELERRFGLSAETAR
jgi:phenylalanyl-tRNA synthetase beta chain